MCNMHVKENFVKFNSDDLIYNRFDLIFDDNVERLTYRYRNRQYNIDVHYEDSKAILNVWGKQFPQSVFENAIEDIFKSNIKIQCVEVKRAKNNYKDLLSESNDIYILLPEGVEELLHRINSKHRETLKRKKRLCQKKYGNFEIVIYKSKIPSEIVELYFSWKKMTHGTDYFMSPEEYLQKYFVTDGIILKAGQTIIGILFFCQVNKTVYLENLSYNIEAKKFSPGYIVYEMFLEELINRKCLYVYLGGGNYEYKKNFGAEESIAYNGTIFRKEFFEILNFYFKKNKIEKIAIYGLGAVGHAFLKISDRLSVDIAYAIDRQKKQIDGIMVYTPEENLEKVDAVIITLKNPNCEVEEFLNTKFDRIYYWNDIVAKNLMEET